MNQIEKRVLLLNFMIKMPPKPNTPESRLVKMWQKELKQLSKEVK